MSIDGLTEESLAKRIYSLPFVRWGVTAGIGAFLDVITLHFLTTAGLPVFFANIISSFLAITFVYLTSVQYVFKQRKYGWARYAAFVCYYAVSITLFSALISFIVDYFSLIPVVAKIIILPFSFLVNYFFGSKII